MRLTLIGVSHHRSPIELRERVALAEPDAARLAQELADGCEAVVLSTCNRTELYLAADADRGLETRAAAALLELAGDAAAGARACRLPPERRVGCAPPVPCRRGARFPRAR